MWDPSILLEFYVFPLQEYRVVLPSFLAEGGSKMNPAQRQIRGIFDDHILSHTPGDKYIFEVVREYFESFSTPIEQYVEGRFTIQTTIPAGAAQGAASIAVLSVCLMTKYFL